MKVSDEMIDAAVKAWNDSYIFDTTLAMRAAVEAAINVYTTKINLNKSKGAKARWARTSAMDRHLHMAAANKKRHPDLGY
jgi:hypothetical protein